MAGDGIDGIGSVWVVVWVVVVCGVRVVWAVVVCGVRVIWVVVCAAWVFREPK